MTVTARIAAFAAVFALAAPALAEDDNEDKPSRDCFNTRTVSGFSVPDDDLVRVRAGASRQYDLEVASVRCDDLSFANRITINGFGSSFICVGDRNAGEVRSNRGDRCRILSVSRYVEPEEGEDETDQIDGQIVVEGETSGE